MKRDRTLIATKRVDVAFLCYFLQSNGVKQRKIQALRSRVCLRPLRLTAKQKVNAKHLDQFRFR